MAIRTWESEEYHSFWRDSDFAYLDRMERRLLRGLIDSGDWFIDIGGGYGRLMGLYKDKFAKAVITDYSLSMLEDAHRFIVRHGIRNVFLVAADVHHLPFIDGIFDTAMMIRLIHHVENPAPVIQEVHRILKPRSSFIFEFQNKRNFNFLFKTWLGLMSRRELDSRKPYQAGSLYWNFHPRTMKNLLAEGFTLDQTLGGGLFWHRKMLTSIFPKLEFLDSALSRFLGRYALTHQLFLKLRKKGESHRPYSRIETSKDSLCEILKCPVCSGAVLESRNSRLICAACQKTFPIRNDIFDFRS
jgi:ubiquinone/menaquinone biosynthesis C-methylase UbiE